MHLRHQTLERKATQPQRLIKMRNMTSIQMYGPWVVFGIG